MLGVDYQWAVVKTIAEYTDMFYTRADNDAHAKRMKSFVVSQTMLQWMKDDEDIQFMLRGRSNLNAWSAIKTRGSKAQCEQYMTWLREHKQDPAAHPPTRKEHELGQVYARNATYKHLSSEIKEYVVQGTTLKKVDAVTVKKWAYILYEALHFNFVDSMFKLAQLFNKAVVGPSSNPKVKSEKVKNSGKTRGKGKKRERTFNSDEALKDASGRLAILDLLINGSEKEREVRTVRVLVLSLLQCDFRRLQ
jgi:hypothetical protein